MAKAKKAPAGAKPGKKPGKKKLVVKHDHGHRDQKQAWENEVSIEATGDGLAIQCAPYESEAE